MRRENSGNTHVEATLNLSFPWLGVLDKDGGGSVDFAGFARFVGRPDRVGVSSWLFGRLAPPVAGSNEVRPRRTPPQGCVA